MKIDKTVCDSCWNNGLDAVAIKTLKLYDLDRPVTRGAPTAGQALDLCQGCYEDVNWLLAQSKLKRLRRLSA